MQFQILEMSYKYFKKKEERVEFKKGRESILHDAENKTIYTQTCQIEEMEEILKIHTKYST